MFCNVTHCSLVHLSKELAPRTCWTVGARFSGRFKIFSLFQSVHEGCGAHPASNLMDTEVKNGRAIPPLPRTSIWHAIFPFIFITYFPGNRVMFYSKLLSGPRSAVFPLGFPTKILYTFLVSCYLSIIAYPAKFDHLMRYKL
jgi:hypothetical protein